jgi:hypothetical protein
MHGISRTGRDLRDAGEVTRHLVAPGRVFAFLAEHRRELFPDGFTADLFPSRTGRPSLPADLVGSVLVFKELYDLSGAQTADVLKYDLRWKVACGRSLPRNSSWYPDLVNDALAVLDKLAGADAPERDAAAADALGLQALVAGQDVEPADVSDGTDGRWRIARKVAPDRGDLHRGHPGQAHPQVEVQAP